MRACIVEDRGNRGAFTAPAVAAALRSLPPTHGPIPPLLHGPRPHDTSKLQFVFVSCHICAFVPSVFGLRPMTGSELRLLTLTYNHQGAYYIQVCTDSKSQVIAVSPATIYCNTYPPCSTHLCTITQQTAMPPPWRFRPQQVGVTRTRRGGDGCMQECPEFRVRRKRFGGGVG